EFIKNITNDIELFDVIIKYFQNFKDERIYNGKPIYLYKLVIDLHILVDFSRGGVLIHI
ncbi:MAG: hypothetical protein EGR23_10235, partial [Holdemanella biformis]|nr:hypothetical protein [Holdemanella biformis]